MRESKGFTLIELLVVISIVALLSSIVLASLNSAREKGRVASLSLFDTSAYHALGDSATGVWKFDEGAGTVMADISGNNNVGAWASPVWITDTYNKKGSALSFNNGTYVSTGATVFNQPVTAITVSAWVRIATHRSWSNLVAHSWPADGGWILLIDGSGKVSFGVTQSGPQYMAGGASGAFLTTNVWHHLLGTYDGSTVTLYVDGAKYGSTASAVGIPLSQLNSIVIGSGTIGDIDDVRVYYRYFGS